MEKDLVPLVDVTKKSVFLAKSEQEITNKAFEDLSNFINIGFVAPQKILDEFSQFQFLFETSQKQLFKNLFGESKETIIIDTIHRHKVEEELK